MIKFAKLTGAGNDFIVIDNRRKVVKNASSFAKKVCNRKMSVGADGLLLIEKSKVAHFKMRIINADGSEAEMCGNGIRCIALFAFLKKICDRKAIIETLAGLKHGEIINVDKGYIRVNMGKAEKLKLNLKIKIGGKVFNGHYVNTGVPHVIIFYDTPCILDIGRKIRYHKMFKPAGANVNFVKKLSKGKIRIRTYERGVENETYACGTGSTASAYITGKLNKTRFPVDVVTSGGDVLTISTDENENLYMAGKVKFICEGTLI